MAHNSNGATYEWVKSNCPALVEKYGEGKTCPSCRNWLGWNGYYRNSLQYHKKKADCLHCINEKAKKRKERYWKKEAERRERYQKRLLKEKERKGDSNENKS